MVDDNHLRTEDEFSISGFNPIESLVYTAVPAHLAKMRGDGYEQLKGLLGLAGHWSDDFRLRG